MEVGCDPQEDNRNSPVNSDESPSSPRLHDTKATSTSSPKKSRRGTQKRVVHVPLKEVEGSRLKGETNTPPADSWAWRKYGQKPIKGSPYPRGYYRCSSSKGCPARKQVERSRSDPTMVMVTYSCDHNHPWPASRNHHHNAPPPTTTTMEEETNYINNHEHGQLEEEEEEEKEEEPPIDDQTARQKSSETTDQLTDQKFTSLEVAGPIFGDQYGWFLDLDYYSTISSTCMLESPLMARDIMVEEATVFSVREDEESFFADLGELPECTTVFRRRSEIERVEEHCRNLAPWCGTTG
ncbi:hypothetical protein SSX86_003981 [Deinandra increscens subsp. villosa]|uniref:WRKY domain-containing protein n=1 Tax=Deinandra increscens subsp. villosa TaxID=3103831 RepID=A0AAP0DIC4_9ASTR